MGGASKAVNFGYLEEYMAGDRTLMREVLKVFCGEAKEWARRLDADPQNWRPVIHTMKGTSRSVGANDLGDLCQHAESAGPDALPAVRKALDEVVGEIEAWLTATA